jgi:hypothetical protein
MRACRLILPAIIILAVPAITLAQPSPQPPATTVPSTVSTSTSGARATAAAQVVIYWWDGEKMVEMNGDPALSPQAPSRGGKTTTPPLQIGFDPRELPAAPRGIMVGVSAHAEAHAKSSNSASHQPNEQQGLTAPGGTSSSQSHSSAHATAEAHVVVMLQPSSDPADALNGDRPAPHAEIPASQQSRAEALAKLSGLKGWAAGAALLGDCYLAHPDLLNVPIDAAASSSSMSLRELTDRVISIARHENKLPQWIAAAALMHADHRDEAARSLLAKVRPVDEGSAAKIESFAAALPSAPTRAAAK